MINEPGFYNITAAEYHSDPVIEPSLSSGIAQTLISKSPSHAWFNHPRLNPKYEHEEDAKFDIGKSAHAILLEGRMDIIEIIDAPDWRTKLAKERRDAARLSGKVPLLEAQANRVIEMVRVAQNFVMGTPASCVGNTTKGSAEQVMVWKEAETWCRGMMDWVGADKKYIFDYKTTENANPSKFINGPLINLGHDVQAAFYLRGLRALTGKEAEFVWIVQEDSAPYTCSLIAMSPQMMEYAYLKVAFAIDMWRKCIKDNHWPGYPDYIHYAELPGWQQAMWDERIGDVK